MNPINLKINISDFNFVQIEIADSVCSPHDLQSLSCPQIDFEKGVVISGRGPIWLFCFLTHYYHPAKWVATHDPRLGGAIVVQSHSKEKKVGDIISI